MMASMNTVHWIYLLTTAVLASLGGLLVGLLLGQRGSSALKEANARLQTLLEAERDSAREKLATLEQAGKQLENTFKSLAGDALKTNSSEFLKLAEANLKAFQAHAEGELAQREKAVENLVKPIREALEKTEQQIHRIEKERREAFGSLSQHLQLMAQTQQALHGETRNLAQALRRPEVRGQWGELTLKRLAELAGMVQHCDFFEQESVHTDTGVQRPDMVVRLPDGRDIVVDAKTPLDAYLSAVEAKDDRERDEHLQRHARKVRERVRELAGKRYWQQFSSSPDFVVLFIPGDQFLSSALDIDRQLLEDALADKVVLATPTSLVALLRAVAYGWRQEALAENAEQIRLLGEELYDRLAVFSEHLARLGRSLTSSVDTYNKAVGSFDTRVVPGARKFGELGIRTRKQATGPDQIEKMPRSVESAQSTGTPEAEADATQPPSS